MKNESLCFEQIKEIIKNYDVNISGKIQEKINQYNKEMDQVSRLGIEKNENGYLIRSFKEDTENMTYLQWYDIYLYGSVFHTDYKMEIYDMSKREIHSYLRNDEFLNGLYKEMMRQICYYIVQVAHSISLDIKKIII